MLHAVAAASCVAATSSTASAACAGSSSGGGGGGAGSRRSLDVFAFFNLGDVFGHSGVGADAVGVHEADEFGLGQVSRGASFTIGDVGFGGLEGFVKGKGGDLLAALPFLVRVDVEVVSLQHEEAGGEEGFVAVFELDGGCFAFGIFGAAGEESAHHEFVDPSLVVAERAGGYIIDGVDWRMRLVVIAASTGLFESSIEEPVQIFIVVGSVLKGDQTPILTLVHEDPKHYLELAFR